jgi:hypothetical protein
MANTPRTACGGAPRDGYAIMRDQASYPLQGNQEGQDLEMKNRWSRASTEYLRGRAAGWWWWKESERRGRSEEGRRPFANDVRLRLAGNTAHRATETQRLGKTIVRWRPVRAKQSLLSYQGPVCVAWGDWVSIGMLHEMEEGKRERLEEGEVVGSEGFIEGSVGGGGGGGGGREWWHPL